MDLYEYKQTIASHIENIRQATMRMAQANLTDEFAVVTGQSRVMIFNAKSIANIAAELLDEQNKGKDQNQCSQPPGKSASYSSYSPSP